MHHAHPARRSSVVSPILRCPAEVISRIALWAEVLDPLGPPSKHLAFLRTCKAVHRVLRGTNHFLADVFRSKFDVTAIPRRFGPRASKASSLAKQTVRWSTTLTRIRYRKPGSYEQRVADLFHAFLMLTEDDGKNRAQLEWAGTYDFVYDWVSRSLWQGGVGWPPDTPYNALALAIMWMLTTPGGSLHR
jgi:hypothetical protein